MPKFVIERNIPGASTLSTKDLQDIAAKSNAVVAGLGVPYAWDTSYVAGDKIYCVHEAADAETIYRHAREGGFPADKVTEITAIIGPQTGGLNRWWRVLQPARAAAINPFIFATTAGSPSNTAWAIRKCPIFSSTTSGIAAIGPTLSKVSPCPAWHSRPSCAASAAATCSRASSRRYVR